MFFLVSLALSLKTVQHLYLIPLLQTRIQFEVQLQPSNATLPHETGILTVTTQFSTSSSY
jgi:hypothetical protein